MVKVRGVSVTIKELNAKFKKVAEGSVDKEVKAIIRDLREVTPVDTGRARAGWRQEGKSIHNDVEYIDKLNHGSSKQAPAFFVEKTVLSRGSVSPSGVIVRYK